MLTVDFAGKSKADANPNLNFNVSNTTKESVIKYLLKWYPAISHLISKLRYEDRPLPFLILESYHQVS